MIEMTYLVELLEEIHSQIRRRKIKGKSNLKLKIIDEEVSNVVRKHFEMYGYVYRTKNMFMYEREIEWDVNNLVLYKV